jgi:16S rRNA (uracil1498-N3)-methyltransferase
VNDISLKRFLVQNPEIKDGFCVIGDREAHHMSRVLRMGKGDALMLMDGKGGRFLAQIHSVSSDAVTVQIKKTLAPATPSPLEITLCQAVIKSASMDYLIQKTSEVGVTRISPFFSSRSVVHLNEERQKKKQNRWREIAYSAAKQCNRDVPADIGPILSFDNQLAALEKLSGLKVMLWEKESTQDLKGLLQHYDPVDDFTAMVGPEGGFPQEEAAKARQAGFVPVSHGQTNFEGGNRRTGAGGHCSI